MSPRLEPGDRLYVEATTPGGRTLLVGAIVVLRDPADPGRRLIKKLAAVGPGRFELGREGAVKIDPGREGPTTSGGLEVVDLSESQLLVVSEAGNPGRDSRQFGPIERAEVEGWAWWRYAPASRRGPL
jgi:hypothetical protein